MNPETMPAERLREFQSHGWFIGFEPATSLMLTSAALAAKGAKRPKAAGATSSCWKSFIGIPHKIYNHNIHRNDNHSRFILYQTAKDKWSIRFRIEEVYLSIIIGSNSYSFKS